MIAQSAVGEEIAVVENGKLENNQIKVPATELALVGGEVLLYILDLGRYCIFLPIILEFISSFILCFSLNF